MPQHSKELSVALRAVHLASLLTKQHLLTYQSTTRRVDESTKADASEVTVADFAAQAVLISIIHHVFPNDSFIAEESSEMLRSDDALLGRVWELVLGASKLQEQSKRSWSDSALDVKLPTSQEEMLSVIDLGQQDDKGKASSNSGRTWILDPIDGTKTYIRGQQYAVCLCLIDDSEQKVAVLGCPNLNLEQRGENDRVTIEETIVDLNPNDGWILSTLKGHGAYLSRTASPASRQKAEDVLGPSLHDHNPQAPAPARQQQAQPKPSLHFTDSSASPHVSKDLHNRIFEHFAPHSSPDSAPHTRKLSIPAVPEGTPSLALDIWSMQLKYVLLALRAEGADAMVRMPPQSTYHAAVWDHAGGQLLLTESGGVLTDAHGKGFVIDGKTRKLEGNWGVCAVRGGRHVGVDGGSLEADKVHEVLFSKVTEEVSSRRKGREDKGEND